MAILITGGAGYIGSVMTELLRSRGESVVVLDNLSRGHRDAVASGVPFYQGNVGDRELVERILREQGSDTRNGGAAAVRVWLPGDQTDAAKP